MATRRKASESTAVANWDEELAAQAKAAAAMEESTATGSFFGLRAGQLTWNDSPLPGNQMAVIVLDHVLENIFYDGAYDPDTPQSPDCFAFGRIEKELTPHSAAVENGTSQCEQCHNCEKNEFGSADVGKGKACRNVRRLAMISAGTINAKTDEATLTEDPDDIDSAQLGFMKLPVMSVKGWAAYVKQLAGALHRPPHAVFTKVSVVPDPKSQFRVVFECLGEVPNELLGAIMKRHNEAKETIEFPYTPRDPNAEPPEKPAPRRGGKAAAPGRGRKY
jgi:hypothetical protein